MHRCRGAAKGPGWVVLMASFTMATTACGPEQTPLYVTAQDETLALAWRACGDTKTGRDGIVSVSIHPFVEDFDIDSPPPAVWHIRASSPRVAPTSEVVVGTEVNGFDTVVKLATPLRRGVRYAAIANADSDEQVLGYAAFRPDEVADDEVAFDEFRVEARDAYRDRDDADFGCG